MISHCWALQAQPNRLRQSSALNQIHHFADLIDGDDFDVEVFDPFTGVAFGNDGGFEAVVGGFFEAIFTVVYGPDFTG